MKMMLSALAGVLTLASCATSERETFAQPKSAGQPAAATDYGVDIPTAEATLESEPKPQY